MLMLGTESINCVALLIPRHGDRASNNGSSIASAIIHTRRTNVAVSL